LKRTSALAPLGSLPVRSSAAMPCSKVSRPPMTPTKAELRLAPLAVAMSASPISTSMLSGPLTPSASAQRRPAACVWLMTAARSPAVSELAELSKLTGKLTCACAGTASRPCAAQTSANTAARAVIGDRMGKSSQADGRRARRPEQYRRQTAPDCRTPWPRTLAIGWPRRRLTIAGRAASSALA
jgi:hypothetical protein